MKKEEGMKVVKKVSILSVAYVACIFYAILGFFQGLNMAIQIKSPTIVASMNPAVLEALSSLGWWLILILPIVFVLIGFIAGALVAWLYNCIAKYTGGIRVKLE